MSEAPAEPVAITDPQSEIDAPSGGEYEGLPTFENATFQAKPHGLPDSTADHPLSPVPDSNLLSAAMPVFDPTN